MTTKSLTEIANLHGTDKGTIGPSPKWSAHNYTDIYEAYLERYRYSAITILEIGLGVVGDRWDARIVHGRNKGGASLKMWYEYFPNASIYGIDVNDCSYLDNDRIKTFVADQGNIHDLEAFTEVIEGIDFDIIIDDGSHRPDHQQISLSYFFRKLKSGGHYFIEDLLLNGLGDSARGRHVCDKVKNTRIVLKQFRKYGKFLEPNALVDQTYLKTNIAYLNFHVPIQHVKPVFCASFRRPFKKVFQYKPDTEDLCVLRKK